MALKENHPKRQHCVPQFLLRNFVDDKDKFYVFDKAKVSAFESKPGAVIAESWFYDFVDGKDEPHTFEYILSEHESTIATLVGSIIDRQSIAHLTPWTGSTWPNSSRCFSTGCRRSASD